MKARILLLGTALAFGALACQEEGVAEKAGRNIDEAVDKIRHGDEGALEKAGRHVDEAMEDAQDAAEEVQEDIQNAGK